jgi:hypothetical protein
MKYAYLALIAVLCSSCCTFTGGVKGPVQASPFHPASQPLFEGDELGSWSPTKFGGEGEVAYKDGVLTLNMGYPMTGVTYLGKDFPTMNYEIALQARRVDGNDFFVGLTFPIDDTHASLILGGWGGTVTGLSSINHFDASENETMSVVDYQQNQWYNVRVRVVKDHVTAWLDDKVIVDVKGERKWSTRPEVDLCKPLGLANFQTVAEIKNLCWRKIEQ